MAHLTNSDFQRINFFSQKSRNFKVFRLFLIKSLKKTTLTTKLNQKQKQKHIKQINKETESLIEEAS